MPAWYYQSLNLYDKYSWLLPGTTLFALNFAIHVLAEKKRKQQQKQQYNHK